MIEIATHSTALRAGKHRQTTAGKRRTASAVLGDFP